ncbi:MAG: SEC-C domain-containing protein [Clostridiales bacterium]|nr:SEC-C domain-containing protein [Clostridiales bacterium]
MSTYYETWIDRSETVHDQTSYKQYITMYYSMEQEAYDRILKAYPDNENLRKGKASELAKDLGFKPETMDIFVGFLDGIKSSLNNELDVEGVNDDSDIELDIDYEKLYYNMRDAKAEWLFKLSSWKNVLSDEQMSKITRDYREANIAHSEKIGRNDPCPCGSGKKYKKCCGKNA